jgi:hypothetical protein
MKIGVISDTHLENCNRLLEKIAADYFNDVDIVLHAGDIVNLDVLDVFKGKEVHAVSGNMDPDSVKKILPIKKVLEIEGHKIGLIHGWGIPFGMEKEIIKEFEDIDCLVYGHTHQAENKMIDGVLFFNPGSPTDRRFAMYNSIGILETGEKITGEIIYL